MDDKPRCKQCTGDISDMPGAVFCCKLCEKRFKRKQKAGAKDQISKDNDTLNRFAQKFMPKTT